MCWIQRVHSFETSNHADAADLFAGRGSTVAREPVSTTTLDHFASGRAGFRCDLLKLDVQGFELPALRGAKETLKSTRAIIAEVRFKPLYENDVLFADPDRFAGESGFRLQCITEVTRQPRDSSDFEANALWCRQADLQV
jgi:hypothetical protein